MPRAPAPFECSYTPNLPELLMQLDCSLALSTYQAGKVVFFSAKDEERVVQLPRTFAKPMAMGLDGNRLAIAAQDEVVVLANEPTLAADYPRQPGTLDGIFVPRAAYFTGRLDVHGLAWGNNNELWAVATRFSCLATLDDRYSFVPRWKPPFITALASEDRCHLNGMAMADGAPAYVTMLGTDDDPGGWRAGLPGGGALMHVPTSEIIHDDLSLPHSPRLYDGKLYMLLSGTGELVAADPDAGTYEVVRRIDGFLRGMSRCGDYLFIARSKLRQNASTFKDLPIASKAKDAGINVIHLPTGAHTATLTYNASVDEIFDVQVLPGLKRPGILNTVDDTYRLALATPDATFWARPAPDDETKT